MDLSIIVVNYNSREKTLNCLKSIFESDLAGIDFEVILVDNNSKENIETEVNDLYPQVKIIKSEKNLGMGGGNNLGIKEAAGKYVLILNPDTMPKPDAIRKMYNYLEANEKVGIAGPKLLYPDGQLQYSCFRGWKFLTPLFRRTFLGRIAKKHLDNFLMRDFDHNSAREVDWLMGSCLMIRESILDKIGFFDERFFMYFEDTDLCRRVRQAGQQVIYFPEAIVIHDHVRASAKKPWYLAPFLNKLSRTHIASWIKYFLKWH